MIADQNLVRPRRFDFNNKEIMNDNQLDELFQTLYWQISDALLFDEEGAGLRIAKWLNLSKADLRAIAYLRKGFLQLALDDLDAIELVKTALSEEIEKLASVMFETGLVSVTFGYDGNLLRVLKYEFKGKFKLLNKWNDSSNRIYEGVQDPNCAPIGVR